MWRLLPLLRFACVCTVFVASDRRHIHSVFLLGVLWGSLYIPPASLLLFILFTLTHFPAWCHSAICYSEYVDLLSPRYSAQLGYFDSDASGEPRWLRLPAWSALWALCFALLCAIFWCYSSICMKSSGQNSVVNLYLKTYKVQRQVSQTSENVKDTFFAFSLRCQKSLYLQCTLNINLIVTVKVRSVWKFTLKMYYCCFFP